MLQEILDQQSKTSNQISQTEVAADDKPKRARIKPEKVAITFY
jgi:hypothetical protein